MKYKSGDDSQDNSGTSSDSPLEAEVKRVSDSPIARDQKAFTLSDLSFKSKALLSLILGALIAIAYLTSSLRSQVSTTKSNLYELDPDQVEKRQILPDYIFKDALAKTSKLSDFHGQVLILSFWASWCSPCLVELPTFAQMKKKLKAEHLQILAVNLEEDEGGKKFAQDFWARNKFDFLSFFDPTKELAQNFQVDLLPSNFVIDKSGRLAFSGFGSTDWGSSQIVDLIDGLLQEPAQEIAKRPDIPAKSSSIIPIKNGPRDDEAAEEDVD